MNPLSIFSDCGGGYGIAMVEDGGRTSRVSVDLNARDGTPRPRVIFSDGRSVNVGSDFVAAYRRLADTEALREEDRETECRALLPNEPALVFRGLLDMSFHLSPQGYSTIPLRGFDGTANSFNPNWVELGTAFMHRFSSDTRLSVGIDISLNGETFVLPGTGLQMQQVQPDIHGSLELQSHGFFLGAGIWHSFLGVERLETVENFTVTRSFTHYYGLPSADTGMRVGYRNRYVEVMAELANGWNNYNYVFDNNNHPSFLGSLAVFPTEDFTIRASVLGGPEKDGNARDMRWLGDFQLAYRGRPFGILLNVVHGADQTRDRWDHWTGALGAIRVHPNRWPVSMFGGFEYFNDAGGSRFSRHIDIASVRGGIGIHLVDWTRAGSSTHRVELRTEARSDWDITPGGTTGLLGASNQTSSVAFTLLYEGELPFYSF